METIKKKWLKIYGYSPTDSEIINAYYCGEILLSDKEENEILKYISNNS